MKEHISEDLNSPNKSSLGSVGQVPSVGSEVLPANVFGVMPQSAHLKKRRRRRIVKMELLSKDCV